MAPYGAADLLVGTGFGRGRPLAIKERSMGTELDCKRVARSSTRAVIPQVSLVTATLTAGGIIGCLCLPLAADRWGRRGALFVYFLGALLQFRRRLCLKD
jgi:MFS family permease